MEMLGDSGATPLFLASIEQWGSIQWETMYAAFSGCTNMVYNATDVPDLSNVVSMFSMFDDANSFNGNIGNWDVSNVTDMSFMFNAAHSFNGDISGWDTSNVTNMSYMFFKAHSFNGDISGWDTSNVTNMIVMFKGASSFDQDLGSWNIGSLTGAKMINMLDNSGMSPQNLNATLIGWHAFVQQNNGPNDIELGLEGLTSCGEESFLAAFALDVNYNWEFVGATFEETCN
ncbi:hypothetical protein DKG77_09520 [Flagellimonas aquimarina]|uniref:BspA family leucine-rich repeat surface protein n=2 Tax=Flagellimonas aquimarina TaxID=2201895 RepID=A0A316L000_9FLAO|nr:hypothetical protein DKG77_09520 [Allomuricauda koreensis]